MNMSKMKKLLKTRARADFEYNISIKILRRVRTNIKAMCLSVYGVKLWNTLPDDIKNCTSINILKKCLKKHFLSHY